MFIKISVPLRPLIFNVGVFQFHSGQVTMPTAGEGGCSEPGVLFSLWTEEGSTLYTDCYGSSVFRGTSEKAESALKHFVNSAHTVISGAILRWWCVGLRKVHLDSLEGKT